MSDPRTPQAAPEPQTDPVEPQPTEPIDQQQQPTEPQAPPPAVDEPPRQDWRDRRLGEQQQRLRERNARIAELEARIAQYEGQGGQPPQPGTQPQYGQQPTYQPAGAPQGDIQRQINEAAARMAATQEFTRRCNEVAEGGRRQYQNFDARVTRLVGLIDANDQQQVLRYNSFLEAAMNTGQASRLIYELGGDLDEASRIMAMNPQGMQHELTRLSMRNGTEASGAPRPLSPVASTAQSNRQAIQPDDPETADTITTEEWMRRREEQIATRRQRTLG